MTTYHFKEVAHSHEPLLWILQFTASIKPHLQYLHVFHSVHFNSPKCYIWLSPALSCLSSVFQVATAVLSEKRRKENGNKDKQLASEESYQLKSFWSGAKELKRRLTKLWLTFARLLERACHPPCLQNDQNASPLSTSHPPPPTSSPSGMRDYRGKGSFSQIYQSSLPDSLVFYLAEVCEI